MLAGSTFRDREESIYCLTTAGYDLRIDRCVSRFKDGRCPRLSLLRQLSLTGPRARDRMA
jgi:hypothetical protein